MPRHGWCELTATAVNSVRTLLRKTVMSASAISSIIGGKSCCDISKILVTSGGGIGIIELRDYTWAMTMEMMCPAQA
jgi:Na+-transporting NADH:ubiquinone oxidoreductase subunit NqrF